MSVSIKKIGCLALILVIAGLILGCGPSMKYDDFVSCLNQKGVKVYGAYWCSACATQKKPFGDSWKKVNYIECSLPNKGGVTAVCQQAGIMQYPTWEFPGEPKVAGVFSMEELSTKSGCALP